MDRFWIIVYFFAYKTDYKLHLWFNKINPFMLIHKLPFQKRLYQRKGINIDNEINKAFKHPDIGLSSIRSGGLMHILVFLICWSAINLYSAIIQKQVILNLYVFIIFIFISFIANHFLLFKHNKYLSYFKEFEKMEKKNKKKWAWISFGVILSIFIFSLGCFIFMNYRLGMS